MQTTFWMTLQKILNYLWHKIKIKAVYIYNSKLCGWPLELNLSGFNPQLFPFSGNWDKTLARIGDTKRLSAALEREELDAMVRNVCIS